MNKLIPQFTVLLLAGWSINVWAFSCMDASGQTLHSMAGPGSVNVYVNLQPTIAVGQNLVVNISRSVVCRNDAPTHRNDNVMMLFGSMYGGALSNFTGTLRYYGSSYTFPLRSATSPHNFTSGSYVPWNTQLYLTPISAASSVAIKGGTRFAQLVMYQVGSDITSGGNIQTVKFTWNLYSMRDVVVPTGGCDVSARDVTMTLPNYPGSMAVPVTVHCAQNQNLSYYLSGTTTDSANSIFANTASASPAQGVGVQMTRNGAIVSANNTISLGTVGPSPVNLGLTANYARTIGQVTAGNVQSLIGVTFIYQ